MPKSNNPWSNKRRNSDPTSKQWLDILTNEENPNAPAENGDFEVNDSSLEMPNMMSTTSTNPKRPRTVKAGFDYKNFKMIVVFPDGTWWQYNGVPVQMWENFKAAESKGSYMHTSGLNTWPDMHECNFDELSKGQRTQINDMKDYLKYIYEGK